MASGGGGAYSLTDGLNVDVRPDRIWFSEAFFLNGVPISSRPYVFVNLQAAHKKPDYYQFANVQHIEIRNSL